MRLADGSAVRPGYLLTDGSVEPDAIPVAHDPALGMTVWKVNGPLVLAKTRVTGIYPNDTWSGPSRDLVAGALPRRLPHRLALGRCAAAARRQHRVDARRAASVHVVPNKAAALRVPLTSRGGTCTVVFNIAPTAVPSEVIPGSKDDRELGAHFNAFAYRP